MCKISSCQSNCGFLFQDKRYDHLSLTTSLLGLLSFGQFRTYKLPKFDRISDPVTVQLADGNSESLHSSSQSSSTDIYSCSLVIGLRVQCFDTKYFVHGFNMVLYSDVDIIDKFQHSLILFFGDNFIRSVVMCLYVWIGCSYIYLLRCCNVKFILSGAYLKIFCQYYNDPIVVLQHLYII